MGGWLVGGVGIVSNDTSGSFAGLMSDTNLCRMNHMLLLPSCYYQVICGRSDDVSSPKPYYN